MTDYREVKCIELHNSNITLTTDEESYAFTAPIGRTENPTKPSFSIKLHDIAMLAEMFNIETSDKVTVPKLSSQPLATNEKECIEFLEITIYKNHTDPSDDTSREEKIIKIECHIVSDNTVNIRVTSKSENETTTYIEEISYCGSYTIWWENVKK